MQKFLPTITITLILSVFTLFSSSCSAFQAEKPKILVFSKTEGWHHESLPEANRALMALGAENGIEIDTTTNSGLFTEDNLKQYDAVVFLSSTGDVFNKEQEKTFKGYINAGGGFMGIHGASDTEHDWEWYGELVGGYFLDHPEVQEAVLHIKNREHISTEHLPEQWVRTDEYYNFRNFSDKVTVLITIDEDSYEGGDGSEPHPMAWYHEFDGGRAFYTALGHLDEHYSDPLFLQHILGGLRYAMGEAEE